jgi:hypothetical protein
MLKIEKKVDSLGIFYCIRGTDVLHREDGPASEGYNGTKEWYKEGELHRDDGPAIICEDGTTAWYLNGLYYSKEEWFGNLREEQKEAMLYSEYFISK